MSGFALSDGKSMPGSVWSADGAYTSLVARHRDGLVRLAILLGASRADAEDAVQEAVLAVGLRWSTVRQATALAYLRTAVVHAVRDVQRRQRESPGVVPDRAVDDPALLRLEEDRWFLQLVGRLPEQQRTVVVLRYSVGMPTGEIARALGVSAITVRSQSSRALGTLRRAMLESR